MPTKQEAGDIPMQPDDTAAAEVANESSPTQPKIETSTLTESDPSSSSVKTETSSPEVKPVSTDSRPLMVKQNEKIPKFGGDAKCFREWFEQFELATVGRSPLERFGKLEGPLTGDALEAISHLSLTSQELETAIAIVEEEFGSVFSAQYAHVVSLDILEMYNNKAIRSTDKWHSVIPAVSQNVKAIEASGSDFEDSRVVLLPVILEASRRPADYFYYHHTCRYWPAALIN